MVCDGILTPDFEESNAPFMNSLAESIADYIPTSFAEKIENNTLHYSSVHELNLTQLELFLAIIDTNIGPYYVQNEGNGWKGFKRKEMRTPGLIYVWYVDGDEGIVGFMSFMMTMNRGVKDLYLYEIHTVRHFQQRGLGSKLIKSLHSLSFNLNKEGCNNPNASSHLKNTGTGLTVFSDNKTALNWYFKLNYNYADYSPRDKLLRNGKILKPNYYILERKHIVN